MPDRNLHPPKYITPGPGPAAQLVMPLFLGGEQGSAQAGQMGGDTSRDFIGQERQIGVHMQRQAKTCCVLD